MTDFTDHAFVAWNLYSNRTGKARHEFVVAGGYVLSALLSWIPDQYHCSRGVCQAGLAVGSCIFAEGTTSARTSIWIWCRIRCRCIIKLCEVLRMLQNGVGLEH